MNEAVRLRHIFSAGEDVQYKQGSSAQGVLLKIVSNESVITLTNFR